MIIPSPRRHLGLWRLTQGIGRGGMGEVYEAEYDYLHVLTLKYPAPDRPRCAKNSQIFSEKNSLDLPRK